MSSFAVLKCNIMRKNIIILGRNILEQYCKVKKLRLICGTYLQTRYFLLFKLFYSKLNSKIMLVKENHTCQNMIRKIDILLQLRASAALRWFANLKMMPS